MNDETKFFIYLIDKSRDILQKELDGFGIKLPPTLKISQDAVILGHIVYYSSKNNMTFFKDPVTRQQIFTHIARNSSHNLRLLPTVDAIANFPFHVDDYFIEWVNNTYMRIKDDPFVLVDVVNNVTIDTMEELKAIIPLCNKLSDDGKIRVPYATSFFLNLFIHPTALVKDKIGLVNNFRSDVEYCEPIFHNFQDEFINCFNSVLKEIHES